MWRSERPAIIMVYENSCGNVKMKLTERHYAMILCVGRSNDNGVAKLKEH